MTDTKASPTPEPAGSGAQGDYQSRISTNKTTKIGRFLQALIDEPRGMTKLDLWHEIGDSCPNTTASKAQQKHGLRIDRRLEDVPTRYGTTKVARYWLGPEARQQAREVLAKGAA
jgi:hypothetical protein